LRYFRPGGERLAILDTETTGFSKTDRIVEVAVLTVVDGEIVDEFDTLLQPQRDPGPVHIHGITPSMVQAAPLFADVAHDLAVRLDGAVLVAHNIQFDLRMLRQEFDRIEAAEFDAGEGICTYRLTRKKLSVAAAEAGLEATSHTALGDARAVAALAQLHSKPHPASRPQPAACSVHPPPSGAVTVRRPNAPPRRGSLHAMAATTSWPGTPSVDEAVYLDALDRCLDDGVLDDAEQRWLNNTAAAVGLSDRHRAALHSRYYQILKAQILADGVVTSEEAELACSIAGSLNLTFERLATAAPPNDQPQLSAGMRVCFTGTSTVDGKPIRRDVLVRLAETHGLVTVANVTRKCDVLVAADPLSQSGKANNARTYNIAIVSTENFLGALTQ
jgi:DNA polymerase-3 subunit epsilon